MNNYEAVNCPVCNSNKYSIKFPIQYESDGVLDKLKIDGKNVKVKVYLCGKCFHSYANPQLKGDLITEYYSKLDSEYYKTENPPIDDMITEDNRIINIIKKYKNSGNILELGCGYGFLLKKFERESWNIYGIEPSKHASEFGKKELLLNIKQGFLTLGDFPPQFFDVIIMSDVIEHLRKPNELFELIKHYLKPDAIILIKTGNIDSLYAKICGRWWGYFGSWEHISFFSPRSIEYLLKENNLKLNDIYFVPHFSGFIKNLKSVVYSLTVILVKNLIKSALNKFFQKNYKTRQLLIAYDHIIVVSRPSDLT